MILFTFPHFDLTGAIPGLSLHEYLLILSVGWIRLLYTQIQDQFLWRTVCNWFDKTTKSFLSAAVEDVGLHKVVKSDKV